MGDFLTVLVVSGGEQSDGFLLKVISGEVLNTGEVLRCTGEPLTKD